MWCGGGLRCDISLEIYSTNILVTTQSAARYATNIKHLSLQLDRQKFEVFGNEWFDTNSDAISISSVFVGINLNSPNSVLYLIKWPGSVQYHLSYHPEMVKWSPAGFGELAGARP
jgi:hypothetical protein